MEYGEALIIFEQFLLKMEAQISTQLARVALPEERLSKGWAFHYNSRCYIEGGNVSDCLAGQGPVVVRDDGVILEGGSLDWDPEEVLQRHEKL